MANWIDVHSHLNSLDSTPEVAIELARAAGIERIITIGTEPADHRVVLELAEKLSPHVYCTLGVHPHEAQLYTEEVERFIFQHAPGPRVVGIGEIGLDYYYSHSPHEVQREVFTAQLAMAERLNLPVEIHTRDAEADTIKILSPFRGRVKGLIHCFSGSLDLARSCLDIGFDLSFSGIVTFKSAEELREVVRFTPLDRLHVETDSPFLSPVPQRGRKNTPAFMLHTATKVAEIKNISLDELSQSTLANAARLFTKINFAS
jgi:TatD DNase family protein